MKKNKPSTLQIMTMKDKPHVYPTIACNFKCSFFFNIQTVTTDVCQKHAIICACEG